MTPLAEYRAQALVEHYHKMIDVQTQQIERRSRLFLSMLILLGIAGLLTWRPTDTTPAFERIVASLLKLRESDTVPLSLVQPFLLAIVFYLTFNLYHRELGVRRQYSYLEALEGEVRKELALPPGSVAFARESGVYPKTRPPAARTLQWAFRLSTGVLLAWFLVGRLLADWRARDSEVLVLVVDVLLALATFGYFVAYLSIPKFKIADCESDTE